jgi:hypothetical protein
MILYVFIDGVGFGSNNPQTNPFARYSRSFFKPLAGLEIPTESLFSMAYYIPTDANMGKKGLPQSATGQTSLWTGVNTPAILDRHVSGYPSFTLKKILAEFSVIKILEERGKKASFLNCYSPPFFEKIQNDQKHLSASTFTQLAGQKKLRDFKDLEEYRGLFMDITHRLLKKFAGEFLAPDHPLMQERDPFEMGKLAVRLAREEDLTMFEYFLTDKVGHSMDWDMARQIIGDVEAFMEGIASEMNLDEELLIVSSDHGNLEDLTEKVHTTNLVPTVLLGKRAEAIKQDIQTLADIVPCIYKLLNIDFKPVYKKELKESS